MPKIKKTRLDGATFMTEKRKCLNFSEQEKLSSKSMKEKQGSSLVYKYCTRLCGITVRVSTLSLGDQQFEPDQGKVVPKTYKWYMPLPYLMLSI